MFPEHRLRNCRFYSFLMPAKVVHPGRDLQHNYDHMHQHHASLQVLASLFPRGLFSIQKEWNGYGRLMSWTSSTGAPPPPPSSSQGIVTDSSGQFDG